MVRLFLSGLIAAWVLSLVRLARTRLAPARSRARALPRRTA
jgi:hypothetical protein